MIRRIDDFTHDWEHEHGATLKLLRALTDASLAQRVTDEGRSIQDLAWHMVLSLPDTLRRLGFSTSGPADDAPAPHSADDIADTYERVAGELADRISTTWTDATLEESVSIFGQEWKKGFILASVIRHQAHHRGQLTVLMRQARLTVPGIYGPAREEWAAMGREPER
jgi:uncharacterized damage-inducible protein DinB